MNQRPANRNTSTETAAEIAATAAERLRTCSRSEVRRAAYRYARAGVQASCTATKGVAAIVVTRKAAEKRASPIGVAAPATIHRSPCVPPKASICAARKEAETRANRPRLAGSAWIPPSRGCRDLHEGSSHLAQTSRTIP